MTTQHNTTVKRSRLATSSHSITPVTRPKLTMLNPTRPTSYLDKLPKELLLKVITEVTAMDWPHDLLDSFPRANDLYRERRPQIVRDAIMLAVDDSNADVAFMAYKLFQLPQHGIDRAIQGLNQEPWTVDRLLTEIEGPQDQLAFLRIARFVNLMAAHFCHFSDPERYWPRKMNDYLYLHPSAFDVANPGAPGWSLVDDFYKSRDEALFPYRDRPIFSIGQGSSSATYIKAQRQFWMYELQCRARIIDCVGISCGDWVADHAPDEAVVDYLLLCDVLPMHCFARNEGLTEDQARTRAWSHRWKESRSMGVKMAEFWLLSAPKDWVEGMFCLAETQINKVRDYCLDLSPGYQTWCDPWFQEVEAPVVVAGDGQHDGPVSKGSGPYYECLPRIF